MQKWEYLLLSAQWSGGPHGTQVLRIYAINDQHIKDWQKQGETLIGGKYWYGYKFRRQMRE